MEPARSVDALVTAAMLARYGERLPAGVVALAMQADGRILREGDAVDVADIAPEVAWASADLFEEGGPVVPFFGALLAAPVRWLQVAAAGVDHPVFAALMGKGTRLTTSHVTDVPISEYVLGMVLGHFLGIERWRSAQDERAWRRHELREVAGTTWLVVGVGAIGSAVARRAAAFGAHVVGCRRTPAGDEPVDELVPPSELHTVLPRADVVVLAVPATASSHRMVDERFLAAMRPGSVLVNVARGAVVDEGALVTALDRGVPEVAILDVMDTEPLPSESALWAHPRVRLTPHNAGMGTGCFERGADLFFDNLTRWLAGRELRNEVTELEPTA